MPEEIKWFSSEHHCGFRDATMFSYPEPLQNLFFTLINKVSSEETIDCALNEISSEQYIVHIVPFLLKYSMNMISMKMSSCLDVLRALLIVQSLVENRDIDLTIYLNHILSITYSALIPSLPYEGPLDDQVEVYTTSSCLIKSIIERFSPHSPHIFETIIESLLQPLGEPHPHKIYGSILSIYEMSMDVFINVVLPLVPSIMQHIRNQYPNMSNMTKLFALLLNSTLERYTRACFQCESYHNEFKEETEILISNAILSIGVY